MSAARSNMHSQPRYVIWFTTDHMRYDLIEAHDHPAMHTPNLDALIRGGVSFDRCYANAPLCMPSRSSFMTGCYPQQTGVMDNGQELNPDFSPTIANCFGAGGYRTIQIGKLHFQCHEDEDLDPRSKSAFGFDVFRLSEEPGCYEDAYMTWLRGEHPEWVNTFALPRPVSPQHRHEGPRVLDAPWQLSHSGWVAEQACRYLDTWGPRPEPQFMHLGFYAPHPPLNPTHEMFAPYDGATLPPPVRDPGDWNDAQQLGEEAFDAYRRHFFAMITGVDLAIGQVLDTLKKQGMLNDTLILFGSDHGDACGDHGRLGKDSSYYEGIMRLPLIMHWPNGLKARDRRVPEMIEMVDVMPTLLELAGLPVPPSCSGRSYAEALREDAPINGRDDVYAVYDRGDIMLRTAEFKYLRYPGNGTSREVLYDLAKDPNEFHNVVDDPAYAQPLAELRDRAFSRTVEASRSIKPKRLLF